jgi:soluble lytic murein transglycosylase-like protein
MMDLPPCLDQIASHYQVPPAIIRSISEVEGGRPGIKVGPNRDGSYDLGLMQINTRWVDGSFNVDLRTFGVTERELLSNDCTNLAVGAWLLRYHMDRHGNWETAAAAYHAGESKRHARYAKAYAAKVMRALKRLTASAQAKRTSLADGGG